MSGICSILLLCPEEFNPLYLKNPVNLVPPCLLNMNSPRICLPFSVNFEELHKYQVSSFSNFQKLQILDFCLASTEPIFPEIVEQFWSSCTISPSDEIYGHLLGHDILLSRALVAELFGCDDYEEMYYHESWQEQRVEDDIIELVYNDENLSNLERTKQANLSYEGKVLHNLVTRIICPRTEDVETVTNKDLFVIFSILNDDHINIVDIAYDHLMSAFKNPGQSIPYGHLLTKMLKRNPLLPPHSWNCLDKIPSELLGVDFFRGKGLQIDDLESDLSDLMDSSEDEDYVLALSTRIIWLFRVVSQRLRLFKVVSQRLR